MAMGKSFKKSMLFVLGIVFVASAFSGCLDDVLGMEEEIDAEMASHYAEINRVVNNYTADKNVTIPLDHLVVTNPKTPEAVAVALISSMDNVDTDGMDPYKNLWTAEIQKRMDYKLLERDFKKGPDHTSMTIDHSEKFDRESGGFGYEIIGTITIEDGRTVPYKINLNNKKKVEGVQFN